MSSEELATAKQEVDLKSPVLDSEEHPIEEQADAETDVVETDNVKNEEEEEEVNEDKDKDTENENENEKEQEQELEQNEQKEQEQAGVEDSDEAPLQESPDKEEKEENIDDDYDNDKTEEIERVKSKKHKREKSESNDIDGNEEIEDEQTRKRRAFEEKFNALLKKPTKRRKNNDVDLEAMQDEAIAHLKNMMKEAAYIDIDCVNNKKPATNKLKLLPQVKDTLLKSNLYDSILDNNLLEAVRIWLEPLPDASLPSFEIQKTLLNELVKLPIKTIHLRESGLGKVMIFYQKSKKVDPTLKRIAEKLIGDWTRPVMGRSDNYRAREVPTASFDIEKFKAKTKLSDSHEPTKQVRKSLYQESADRRKRAAAPEARTSVYTIAPQSNINTLQAQRASVSSMGIGTSLNRDERFRAINKKLTKLSQKKKATKKDGVSIEGRGLNV